MIDNKTILAIIPARGGSKGIPRKNIKLLAGKPLIAWTIEEAKKSKYIDRLILSSEDDEIIRVAKEWGCEVPFIRPEELAQDNTPGVEPVIHAINILNEKYDYVCLLQPTSPLRKDEDIDGCIEKCIINKSESCVSITEVNNHPYWMYEIEDDKLISLYNDKNILRRQDLPKVYTLNGAIYFSKISNLMKIRKFVDNKTIGFKMNVESSIDIDTKLDFNIAELLLNEMNNYDN